MELACGVRHRRAHGRSLGRGVAARVSFARRASKNIERGARADSHGSGSTFDRARAATSFKLLRERNVWGLALPRFLADPTWGTLTFWLPLYLTTTRGFDLKQIAMFAWLPFVAADFWLHGWPNCRPWLQRRGVGLINARRCAFTIGAMLMICMIFVPRVESAYAAIALLCLGGFAHQMLSVTCITMATDLFPQNEVGTVAGFAGTFANLGVLLFSLAIGGLVATVGYDPFFIALSLLDLVAAAVLWTVVRASFTFRAGCRDSQSRVAGVQSRSVHRSRWRGLFHRHVDLRMVSGRADLSLSRPGELGAARAPVDARG